MKHRGFVSVAIDLPTGFRAYPLHQRAAEQCHFELKHLVDVNARPFVFWVDCTREIMEFVVVGARVVDKPLEEFWYI